MPRFDSKKLADLVDEESRLKHALTEVSTNLAGLKATDKTWDEARQSAYLMDQQEHQQLTRELQTVRAERQRYELQEPAAASDATSGQEAVQEEIPPRIIDRLAFYGGVSRMAQQFLTGTGGEYRIMQMDAASQEGEILAAQDTAVTEQALPNIGVQTFGAKTASSKPILLTRELQQDAVFDIQTYVE